MKHILLVDDEEAIVYVFRRYLENAGHRVTAAARALEALGAGPVDMLVTDYRMPGMNGAELVMRLRETHPALPALIVTAYAGEVGTAPAGVRILNKPLAPQELVDAVALVLAGDPRS